MRVASKVSNLPSNLGTLWVLELFVMYATDRRTGGQTDGQMDGRTKATLIVPFPTGGGITIIIILTRHCDIR